MDQNIEQATLDCGIDLLQEPLPGYHTATLMLRVQGGMASEPAEKLGLAYVVEQAIDKGSSDRDARAVADAFDAYGIRHAVYTGRQSWVFIVSALPEYLPTAIDLLADVVLTPTFPDESVTTAVTLSKQQLLSLEDYPRGLLRRQMVKQAYGEELGRHQLGLSETLDSITAQGARDYWANTLAGSPLSAAIAGRYDKGAVLEALNKSFAKVPRGVPADRSTDVVFSAATTHIDKDLEQTQIGISFPGVAYQHPDYPVERVLLAVLSGGMSARLFTEVREKRGLVYWVGAWHEQPRKYGMIHVGAATTPQRCKETYEALLKEIGRLEQDLTEVELERAKAGLLSEGATSGASVQRRAGELLSDHFHLGRAVGAEEKMDAIRGVTVDHIKRYLREYPRDKLSIVTVGREPLAL